MKLKSRDKILIGIFLIILIIILAVLATTMTSDVNDDTRNTNGTFQTGIRQTSAAEITDYRVTTMWQKYENQRSTFFEEEGIYKEIPYDNTITNCYYYVYANISNTGNTVLHTVTCRVTYYDEHHNVVHTRNGSIYNLGVLEKRQMNPPIWVSKSSLGDLFDAIYSVEFEIVEIIT